MLRMPLPKSFLRSRLLAAVFVASTLATPADACLWEYGTDAQGHTKTYNTHGERTVADLKSHRRPVTYWREQKTKLAPRQQDGDYKVRNDYAVALIHLGEYDQALEIFNGIEKQHPGIYSTAANLGTAYELKGENVQALKWIEEGIRRNPESHQGTEWVHVKILKAKLELAKDPDWLKTHSVLGVDFGSEAVPRTQDAAEVERLRLAITYQLQERLQFVDAPDPIVADLLADLANLIAIEGPVENALPVYRFALIFQPARAGLVRQRLAHFEQLVQRNPASGQPAGFVMQTWMWGLLGVAGVLLFVALWMWPAFLTGPSVPRRPHS